MEKEGNKSNKIDRKKKAEMWALKIFIITFFIAISISLVSEFLMRNVALLVAIFILLVIIILGVIFDIIGIAVTAASDVPFVAMASKRIKGARQCIRLVQNADQVSNFCNDMVGDICSIVSGAAGAAITIKVVHSSSDLGEVFWSIIISSLIAATTVGGKALGKSAAIKRAKEIVYLVGYAMSFFKSED